MSVEQSGRGVEEPTSNEVDAVPVAVDAVTVVAPLSPLGTLNVGENDPLAGVVNVATWVVQTSIASASNTAIGLIFALSDRARNPCRPLSAFGLPPTYDPKGAHPESASAAAMAPSRAQRGACPPLSPPMHG
jgi:hypothetical protein